MKKVYSIAAIILTAFSVLAYTPALTDFNVNQFGTTGNKVNIKNGALTTNLFFYGNNMLAGQVKAQPTFSIDTNNIFVTGAGQANGKYTLKSYNPTGGSGGNLLAIWTNATAGLATDNDFDFTHTWEITNSAGTELYGFDPQYATLLGNFIWGSSWTVQAGTPPGPTQVSWGTNTAFTTDGVNWYGLETSPDTIATNLSGTNGYIRELNATNVHVRSTGGVVGTTDYGWLEATNGTFAAPGYRLSESAPVNPQGQGFLFFNRGVQDASITTIADEGGTGTDKANMTLNSRFTIQLKPSSVGNVGDGSVGVGKTSGNDRMYMKGANPRTYQTVGANDNVVAYPQGHSQPMGFEAGATNILIGIVTALPGIVGVATTNQHWASDSHGYDADGELRFYPHIPMIQSQSPDVYNIYTNYIGRMLVNGWEFGGMVYIKGNQITQSNAWPNVNMTNFLSNGDTYKWSSNGIEYWITKNIAGNLKTNQMITPF